MKTKNSLRKRICFVGRTNTGKSSLINALVGEPVALASPIPGTTTDSIARAFEILGLGAVLICDTAGFFDETSLAQAREKLSLDALKNADLAVLICDSYPMSDEDVRLKNKIECLSIPCITVYNKSDLYQTPPDVVATNALTGEGIHRLIEEIRGRLSHHIPEKITGDFVQKGQHVLLVIPIDTSAPAGRIMALQSQVIREILDAKAFSTVTAPEDVAELIQHSQFDWVITDSKVVKEVLAAVPETIPVSTFSVLTARCKGAFSSLLKGLRVIDELKEGDRVLIAESCVHTTHEDDIARHMIPKLIEKRTGKKLHFDVIGGKRLPENLTPYRLIVHCGGCMLTQKEFTRRIESALEQGVPVTNYGLVITLCQTGSIQRLRF